MATADSTRKYSIIHADFNGHVYAFNEDGWFNATTAAAYYGKRLDHYLANAETQDYIAALCEGENTRKVGDFVRTQRGRNGGTWFHPDLGVPFARWLDVRFAIWCDRQIRALLTGQHPHFDWQQQRLESRVEFRLMNATLKMTREHQGKETKPHHYSNEARLINFALTGDFKPVDRSTLTAEDLALLAKLELKNTLLMGLGQTYTDRKTALHQYAITLRIPAQPTLTGSI